MISMIFIVIAHRLGEMEKRRVGTRFMDREVTEEDQAKPLIEGNGLFIIFIFLTKLFVF